MELAIVTTNKQEFASELRTEVGILFAQYTTNERNAMSYLDGCLLAEYVRNAFQQGFGEVPQIIEGACVMARGFLNPDKRQRRDNLKKGIGLLLTTAGGAGLVWGIIVALGVGLSVWAAVWAWLAGTTAPLTGGITIAIAVAVITAGIYLAINAQTPPSLSAKAHGIIIDAIEKWASLNK